MRIKNDVHQTLQNKLTGQIIIGGKDISKVWNSQVYKICVLFTFEIASARKKTIANGDDVVYGLFLLLQQFQKKNQRDILYTKNQ